MPGSVDTARGPEHRRRLRAVVLASFTIATLCNGGLGAQTPPSPEARHWWTLWSVRSPEDRLILGMWTLHLDHRDDGWSNDGSVALVWRGYYGGTFETTHGPRGWSAGFERRWWSVERGPVGAMLGYRIGIVYGYDRRLGWMADLFPILPFAQPVVYARLGPVAADFTYTWVVVSVTGAIRF